MKAITICQPYATLVLPRGPDGIVEKRVENRTWFAHYRGPLLIHAGKSLEWLDLVPDPDEPLLDILSVDRESGVRLGEMVLGAVIGIVELVACVSAKDILSGDLEGYSLYSGLRDHKHVHGPWCHIYKNARRFKTPVPYRGRQGFFEVPDELLKEAL